MASWDEAIYASVARAMLGGDWLRLRYAGELWFDKPPLVMWATAFFYSCFGVSEFTTRLFASICGVGTVLATFALGRLLWGTWYGFCGAGMLVTSSLFVRSARFATLDSTLAFFLTLMFLFIWVAREKPGWFWVAGAAFGLAVMTKGFAAFLVLPGVALFALLSGEWRKFLKREMLGGALLALAIALPWHLFQWMEFREQFWKDVVERHLFSRTSKAIEGHAGSWYFYIRVLVNKFRPAIFLGAAAIPWFLWTALRRRDPRFLFVASWVFAGFGIAQAISTKLDWYIFPILPALSLATGYVFARWVPARQILVVALASAAVIALHGFKSRRFFQDYSAPVKALAATVRQDVPADGMTYLIRYHEDPAVTFYWERPRADLEEPAEIEQAMAGGPFYALIRREDYERMKEFMDSKGIKIRSEANGFYWVSTVV